MEWLSSNWHWVSVWVGMIGLLWLVLATRVDMGKFVTRERFYAEANSLRKDKASVHRVNTVEMDLDALYKTVSENVATENRNADIDNEWKDDLGNLEERVDHLELLWRKCKVIEALEAE